MEDIKKVLRDITNSCVKVGTSGNVLNDYMVNLGDVVKAIRKAHHIGVNKGMTDMEIEKEILDEVLNDLI